MGTGIWLGAVLHRLRHAAGNRAPRLSDAAAMTDIVERLRQVNPWMSFSVPDPERVEAADEIERLREHIAALQLVATAHEAEVARLEYLLGISAPVEVKP